MKKPIITVQELEQKMKELEKTISNSKNNIRMAIKNLYGISLIFNSSLTFETFLKNFDLEETIKVGKNGK